MTTRSRSACRRADTLAETGYSLKHNPVPEIDFTERLWDAFADYAVWIFGGMGIATVALLFYAATL